jgi:hypothetical protein
MTKVCEDGSCPRELLTEAAIDAGRPLGQVRKITKGAALGSAFAVVADVRT